MERAAESAVKIWTENFGGNMFSVSHVINRMDPRFAEGLVTMDCPSGENTIVVFKISDEHYAELMAEKARKERARRQNPAELMFGKLAP